MNPVQLAAILALSGAVLAGCNPKDPGDSMSEEDQTAAPAEPTEMPPATDESLAPPAGTTPPDQPPPPDTTTEPTEEPAPPPTG